MFQSDSNNIFDGQQTRFEDNYLTRTYSKITQRPDLAYTELIANSWDSGAGKVKICIPEPKIVEDMYTYVEDDGNGMTEQEFYDRWLTLAYNRLKHQGEFAEIPADIENRRNRRAYGRNGIGRHSMLCFGDKYTVETWRDGVANRFEIAQSGGNTALKIVSKESFEKSGHGTIIKAKVVKNVPSIPRIIGILSARFMYDPQFQLYINDELIGLEQFPGDVVKENIKIFDDLSVEITALSSQKTARRSQQHGVAFWVNGRLVGEPSWVLHKRNLADGRTTIARQYTIIVKSDDLLSDIVEDWTDFKNNDRVEAVYDKVEEFANDLFKGINSDKNNDIKQDIIGKYADDIKQMGYSSRREVIQLVNDVVDESPDLSKNYLEIMVGKLIEINKSTNKKALLDRIFSLSENDADRLNKILDDWDISDMEYILDEIDRRLAAIQAIDRFSVIDGMDELHVLHPLVLEAKWLFGPEFDSSFYVSNKRLSTLMKKYLKKPEFVKTLSLPRSRPDIILFEDGSLIGYATEETNPETGLVEYKRLLVIELKCGGKEITATEIAQTEDYIQELYFSNAFNAKIKIDAFTVGDTISNRIGKSKELRDHNEYVFGKIVAATYSQLVATAEQRLFGLKKQLTERYDSMGTDNLLYKALDEGTGQIAIDYAMEKERNETGKASL